MSLPRALRVAAGLTAGVLPLLLALTLSARPAPQTASPPVSKTPQEVAETLDAIVQPRFQDLTAGTFGLSRLVPAVRGHQRVAYVNYSALHTNTPAEAALLARAESACRPYVVAFLHCAVIPGAFHNGFGGSGFNSGFGDSGFSGSGFGPTTPAPAALSPSLALPFDTIAVTDHQGNYLHQTEPLLASAAVKALPQAMKGKPVSASAGEWTLFLRPVTASQSACLTCHTAAKRGDTLGVMVYAVDNAPQTRRSRSRAMSSDWRPTPA